MPKLHAYVDSILALERQATEQAERGDKKGLIACAESLRAIVKDCDSALALPDLRPEDTKWLWAKRDKAISAMI